MARILLERHEHCQRPTLARKHLILVTALLLCSSWSSGVVGRTPPGPNPVNLCFSFEIVCSSGKGEISTRGVEPGWMREFSGRCVANSLLTRQWIRSLCSVCELGLTEEHGRVRLDQEEAHRSLVAGHVDDWGFSGFHAGTTLVGS
jgi:hypothetical protein